MKFATKATAAALLFGFLCSPCGSEDGLRDQVLREAARKAGLVQPEATHMPVDPAYVEAGELIFQTKKLSLNRETACASCHLDRFGSSDGIPNAVGTGGRGEGLQRLMGGGDIIPRNTLPFWGRGGMGFDVFFWDGKVDASSGRVESQFAHTAPSNDPLVVAVHLPPVEIGEMVSDSAENDALKTESVSTAEAVYSELVLRLMNDVAIKEKLTKATGKDAASVGFADAAMALASFIRDNFKVQSTRFHQFVFEGKPLSERERSGGLIFYGKGGCATCHSGAYFTDFDYHALPFPQAGFGKNGFGIDYGRFNVTLDPADRYKFRTPPLYNVTKTAPYSHSGSVATLADAIRIHVDPLAVYDPRMFTDVQRAEYYQALKGWSQEPLLGIALDEGEIEALVAFLATLEYDSVTPVRERD